MPASPIGQMVSAAKAVKTVAVTSKESLVGTPVFNGIIDVLSSHFDVFTISPARHPDCRGIASLGAVSADRQDLVLSLGGDGTLLTVVRGLKKQLPVLGLNLGGRGII